MKKIEKAEGRYCPKRPGYCWANLPKEDQAAKAARSKLGGRAVKQRQVSLRVAPVFFNYLPKGTLIKRGCAMAEGFLRLTRKWLEGEAVAALRDTDAVSRKKCRPACRRIIQCFRKAM